MQPNSFLGCFGIFFFLSFLVINTDEVSCLLFSFQNRDLPKLEMNVFGVPFLLCFGEVFSLDGGRGC